MSHRALNPEQFHYAFKPAKPKEMDPQPHHEMRAYAAGHGSVAEIFWHHKTGEIANITVRDQFRRQGIATHLLGQARQLAEQTRGVRPPRHSPQRTDAGEAWARSLGERLPGREQIGGRSFDERFERARQNQES